MFWAIQPGAGRRIDAASAPVLQRRISLTLTEVPLGLAVQRIAARARVDVTFSTELIPTGARALIAADHVTVAAALTRVLAHTKTDVLLGEEGQLTLIPQADARIAVDSSGALTGTLIDADNDQPVPYGTVTLLGTDRVIFADASGGFRLLRLTPGTYVVRARQIGYAPRDTTVAVGETPVVTTLTLRLTRIPAILDLVMVEGQRGTGCVTTGIPDSATNPGLAGIMVQVEENVARFRVLLHQYPFRYAREERLEVRFDPGGDVTQRLDTMTYESESDRPYRLGGVVPVDSDTVTVAGRFAHRSMYLPTFSALGDSAFLTTHCFAYGGRGRLAGQRSPELIRIDFRPARAVAVPDVEGSVYLQMRSALSYAGPSSD